jgi:hypothetical protein
MKRIAIIAALLAIPATTAGAETASCASEDGAVFVMNNTSATMTSYSGAGTTHFKCSGSLGGVLTCISADGVHFTDTLTYFGNTIVHTVSNKDALLAKSAVYNLTCVVS